MTLPLLPCKVGVAVDTTGDGILDAVAVDTTGDGIMDTVLHSQVCRAEYSAKHKRRSKWLLFLHLAGQEKEQRDAKR